MLVARNKESTIAPSALDNGIDSVILVLRLDRQVSLVPGDTRSYATGVPLRGPRFERDISWTKRLSRQRARAALATSKGSLVAPAIALRRVVVLLPSPGLPGRSQIGIFSPNPA